MNELIYQFFWNPYFFVMLIIFMLLNMLGFRSFFVNLSMPLKNKNFYLCVIGSICAYYICASSVNILLTSDSYCWWSWHNILFINAIILAIGVVTFKNPIYSLLSLIGVFLHIIVLLLAFRIEFLALIFLIIYVGAIAILFLFVIMMFNLKDLVHVTAASSYWNIGAFNILLLIALPFLKFYFILNNQLQKIFVTTESLFKQNYLFQLHDIHTFVFYNYSDIGIFSTLFYTYYCYTFILISIILLVAMIGAIVLAMSTIEYTDSSS